MSLHMFRNVTTNFTVYCIRNERFTKRRQEDSHEVLRCIFDALRDEELQVCAHISFHVHTYSHKECRD